MGIKQFTNATDGSATSITDRSDNTGYSNLLPILNVLVKPSLNSRVLLKDLLEQFAAGQGYPSEIR
ncbi:hypothetical protein GP486_000353 [Trichoglossum hirsutum]|uniref:Uncharacterized protein n=1 Tax=Trichoglossum hirsutum TaxID=265104 RepID=A0A9P8LIZ0_9PEZI|nr:hypothetical protein GP486_000353 [Trichoglossum hirsutum]